MNKKVVVVLIVLALLGGSGFAVEVPEMSAEEVPVRTCADLNMTHLNVDFSKWGASYAELNRGETFTVSIEVTSGTGQHTLMIDDNVVDGPQSVTVPLSFTFTADGTYFIRHVMTGSGYGNVIWSCSDGDGATAAGCDVLMDIPDSAVGGRFLMDTPVYWTPGEVTSTVITAGSSARVIGIDASGAYYKIIWACDYLWVPVSAMGPNPDAVWGGAPLPTVIVD